VEQVLIIAGTATDHGGDRVWPERLAALFDAHHLRLYRLARRMASDAEEARDLIQQVFLRAARRAASLPGDEAACEAWLVRVLVNLCRDRWRRLRVRQKATFPTPCAPQGSDPEAVAVARATVQSALARLSPRRRAVIALHELEERDSSEIGRLLGLSATTVRWHLAAGRKELRRILLDEEDHHEE
jgi:RNA polymerase sigma-70 factor (ECF subfamily)